jgi:hypothetical protein
MEIISARHLYKSETGETPVDEKVLEFEIWRSKGQWIINISDKEKLSRWGNESYIEITMPDRDYIKFLEDKVLELMKLCR